MLRVHATSGSDVYSYVILIHGQRVNMDGDTGYVQSEGGTEFVRFGLLGQPGATLEFEIYNGGSRVFHKQAQIGNNAISLEGGPDYFQV
jgi:L-ascorbate metabolism protein UlaG (beta-lactamase superfamily)